MKLKKVLILNVFSFCLLFSIPPFIEINYINPITNINDFTRGILTLILMIIIIYLFNTVIEFFVNYNYLSSSYSKKLELFFSVMYINFITYPLSQALGLLVGLWFGIYFFILYIISVEIVIVYFEWKYLVLKIREKNTSIEKVIVLRSVVMANILSLIILLLFSFYIHIISLTG